MFRTSSRSFRSIAVGAAVAVIAALSAVAAGSAVPAYAVGTLSGSGTSADPYLIGSAADLDAAAAMVNADTAHAGAAKADFALTADVDYGTNTFTDFTWFGGTFDGAGHTISNLKSSGTAGAVAPFLTVTGTIENLGLDHLTVSGTRDTSNAGVAGTLAGPGAITGVAVTNSSITGSTAGTGTGNQTGGLVANTSGVVTVHDNVVWNTTITGWKYTSAIATYAHARAVLTDNLISATVKSGGSGGGGIAGGILAQNDGALTVTGNVFYTGSVTGTGQDAAGAIGPVTTTYSSTTDLVGAGVTVTPGSTGMANNGTTADAATLAAQGTYTGLGWDFTGGTTPWTWSETVNHPVVRTAPLLQLTGTTSLVFATGTDAPSDADVLSAVPHRIDQGTSDATFGVDRTGVDFTTAGSYAAKITASDNGSDATPRPITIAVVDKPVVTVINPAVDYTVGDTVTAADVITRSGATVSSSSAVISADISQVDAGTAGTYPVTLAATDHGYTGKPVTVSVVVHPVGTAVIHVNTTSIDHILGDDITAVDVIADSGATLSVDGTINVDLSQLDAGRVGSYPVQLSASGASPVTITVHVDPVPTPVITVAHTAVTYPIGVAPTPAAVVHDLGASIDHGELAIGLSGVDFHSANSYGVSVTGSFRGIVAKPVQVTITVVLPGSGTVADPYRIGTAADLLAAAAMVNADAAHAGAAKAVYALTADIDYGNETFADFTWFGGTFDGAGHAISNMAYSNTSVGSGGAAGLFITLTGTVQDLTLSHITSTALNGQSAGGVASSVNAGTVARVALVDSAVSIQGGSTVNTQAGGLAANSTGAARYTDNMVWNTTVTGDKYAAGAVTYARAGTVITDNLINAKVISPNSGGGSTAGMILAQTNGILTVTDNVVFGGSGSGNAATHAGVGPLTTNYASTTDLVSTAVILAAGSVAGDDGRSSPEADLVRQSTYSGLGWDFSVGSGPWSWVDAGAASHPILSDLPVDLPAPLVRFANPTILVSTQTGQPSNDQLLAAMGASADHGALSISLGDPTDTGVNFQSPGSYPVTVTGTDKDISTSVPATIVITALTGSGTAADPLQIGSISDLDTAVSEVDTGPRIYASADYVLTADLNYAGNPFVGIDRFSGVFDGAGHTISNLTYAANTTPIADADVLAFFRVLDGATVKNLSLNNLTASGSGDVAGLVDNAYDSSITDNSVIAATLASSNGDVGGLVGGTANSNTYAHATSGAPNASDSNTNTTTVTDNEVLDSTISGRWVVSGLVASAKGTVGLARNLVDADVTNTAVVTPGTGVSAAEILGAVGTDNTGGTTDDVVKVNDNVAIGGSVRASTGGARTAFVGFVIGDLENVTGFTHWSESDNLVSPAVTLGSNLTGAPASYPGQGGQDGTASTVAALSDQSTFTGLGWNFGIAPVWAWDATDHRPTLAAVPELFVPTLTLAHTSVAYQVGTAPDDGQILADLGATVSPAGTPTLQLGGADLTQTGSYAVTVGGTANGVGTRHLSATVHIVPVITISTAVAEVEYVAGSSVDAEQLLADVGAATSTPGTLNADLSGIDFATAGAYPATLSAIDAYGFRAAPVSVFVKVIDAPTTPPPTKAPTVTAGAVTISGVAQVGSELTAHAGTWSPAGLPSYQWRRDGSPISGATTATYTPVAADAGHLLQVQVTEQPDGYTATSAVSPAVTVAAGTFTTPTPSIVGTAKVGTTLTANPGTWRPAPGAMAYRWLRNGIPIPGATGARYTLQVADLNAGVSVRIDGVLAGYATALVTSHPVKVGAGTFTAHTPSISGAARVGVRLTVATGTWSPRPSGFKYQWLRNGRAIAGATRSTYWPTASDFRKTVTVRITAVRSGYIPASATSAGKKIGAGMLQHPGRPKVRGTVKVGRTLSVSAGTWSPRPALSYQWYAAGKKIRAATKSRYKIAGRYRGTRLTVKVTGRRTGYTTVTVTSVATKRVAR